jgi:sensor histidine kinase YesM
MNSAPIPSPPLAEPCPAIRDFHPLEVFAWFRRYPPGIARDVVYTLIFNCGIGTVFWVLGTVGSGRASVASFVSSLLITNVIGYTIHAILIVTTMLGVEARMQRRSNGARALYFTGVSMAGVLAGSMLLAFTVEPRMRAWFASPKWLASVAAVSFVISSILLVIIVLREREARAEASLAEERVRLERLEREAARAELRALQAHIEPHFLFNTLANVASLIDSDPALSKRMLERFIGFLRNSLGATRAETTTLGAEGDLIAAYLDVLQVRFASRLRYAIDIAPALATFPIPPMLLQPLVENSIRHGIEPRVAGGEVRVSAVRDGDSVRIEVRDSGVGFAAATHGGTGLTNLRERLRLLYGEAAGFSIGDNPGGGAVVTLRIPA